MQAGFCFLVIEGFAVDAVASGFFGLIEEPVGQGEHLPQVDGTLAEAPRIAAAHRRLAGQIVKGQFLQVPLEPFYIVLERRLFPKRQDQEFVAAIAVDPIIREDMAQKSADAGQDIITEYMTVGIIEKFELVDIADHDTNRLS